MDNYGGDFEKNEEVLSQLTLLNTKIHSSLGGNGYTVTLSLDKWYVLQRLIQNPVKHQRWSVLQK